MFTTRKYAIALSGSHAGLRHHEIETAVSLVARLNRLAGRLLLATAIACCWTGYAAAADAATPATPIKIAVFPFELEDFGPAAKEGENAHLVQATEEAKQQLLKSGRYSVIDATGADIGAAKDQGLRNCNGCEAPIARKLGADQALVGVVSKISNTEYLIKLQVRDARSGEVVSHFASDLRMGADYSWSRGVRSLIQNQMLASK